MPLFFYQIINFLLLILIVYLIGRKMILNIFRGRREKINKALDAAEEVLPEPVVFDPVKPVTDRHKAAVEAETAAREAKLAELKEKFEHESEIIRRESLMKSRSNLIQLTMDKAREYMKSEEFL